jgi:hypothetical protein
VTQIFRFSNSTRANFYVTRREIFAKRTEIFVKIELFLRLFDAFWRDERLGSSTDTPVTRFALAGFESKCVRKSPGGQTLANKETHLVFRKTRLLTPPTRLHVFHLRRFRDANSDEDHL